MGAIATLFAFLLVITLYLLISALLLRFAGRWVLKLWLPWGQAFKVVIINFLILMLVNILLGIAMVATGLVSGDMETLTNDVTLNLASFIISMLISAYVYGHWITPGQFGEPIGFWRGFLIYWAQIVIVLAISLVIGIIGGVFTALFVK